MMQVSFRAFGGYAAGAVLVYAMNGALVFVLALVLQLGSFRCLRCGRSFGTSCCSWAASSAMRRRCC